MLLSLSLPSQNGQEQGIRPLDLHLHQRVPNRIKAVAEELTLSTR
jgi:hypothetical protein